MSDILADFKTESLTVRKVFDGTNYFQIPDYQRPYSWGDDEIGQLWDDLYLAFNNSDKYYFLGPVILAQTDKGYFEVVDGQQRLTTLTILFCVLRDFYLKKLEKIDVPMKRQIVNAVKSMVDERYRMVLITQAYYQNQFEQEILEKTVLPRNALTKKEKEKPKYKFMNAASILNDRLDDLNNDSGISRLREFVHYVFENAVMITITCSSRVSAIRLFQTLNTRGLELDLADLTKSYLFSCLEDEKRKKQFLMSWREIEKIAEDNDETVADLLTYYAYYTFASKPKRALNEEFEKHFRGKDPNKVVYDIKKFAGYYDEILSMKSKSVDSMQYLPDKVFWKTVLITARMKDFPKFPQLCSELRRLYFSYWIANYTTAKTRDFSFNLIQLVKKGTATTELRNKVDKKMKEDNVFEYLNSSLESDAYGYVSWVKPLLLMIEREQTDESVFIEYGRNLHIDHILPEEWEKNKYWRNRWKKDDAEFWLDKVGNLTLLSGRKNIRASNDEFPKKKKIYKGKGIDGTTSFEITKRIVGSPKWTIKEVKERQKWFIKQTKRILDL